LPLVLSKRAPIGKASGRGTGNRARTLGVANQYAERFDRILRKQAQVLGYRVDQLVKKLGPLNMALLLNEIDWYSEWEAPLAAQLSMLTKQELVRVGTRELEKYGVRFSAPFNMDRLESISYVRNTLPRLIRHITEGTRESVRQALVRGFTEQRTPDEMAQDIKKVVGLMPKQAASVARFEARAAAKYEGDGVPPAQAATKAGKLAERYATRVLSRRAQLIARTETIRIHAEGQRTAWSAAAAEGALMPGAKRMWIAGMTDRTCEMCIELADQDPVGLDEPFDSSYLGQVMDPPAHPACRCTVSLTWS
jgi:hypothetical protein